MRKWFLVFLILAILAAIFAVIVGPKNSKIMGNDIQTALSANGYDWASVDMNGHVATINGEAPNLDSARGAIETAQNTECSKCNGKGTWHKVLNGTSVKKAPPVVVQSPYTFDVIKSADGSVVLNGYVTSADARDALIAKARSTFSGTVSDNTIRIASGAPNGNWLNVIQGGMDQLVTLDDGRFQIEDTGFLISGNAASADVRDRLNSYSQTATAPYSGAANINVAELAANVVGEVTSKTICQSLFDDLKEGKEINFASNRDEIRGSESFDLLGVIASAANQCETFRVSIQGHTDAQGDAAYNQDLSDRRANRVLATLADQGVDRNRMTSIGFGESRPVADNGTAEGRRMNRRTEFILTQAQ